MPRHMRLSPLAVACVLTSLLWSKNTCYMTPELSKVKGEGLAYWRKLPSSSKREFKQRKWGEVLRRRFGRIAAKPRPFIILHRENDLLRACSNALGNDIELKRVGSWVRGTASRSVDLDYQVHRGPKSTHFGEPFTEDDKKNVALNLEKLGWGPVTIGNIAIKFKVNNGVGRDLVLVSTPRPEEFPKFRGGNDFYENSERINGFLERTPAARYAIMEIKRLCEVRPKGILLEAAVWRLSETYEGPLTTFTDNPQFGSMPVQKQSEMAQEGWLFLKYVLRMLQNWEESPFGSDLKQDLNMLPDRKREEHIQSFGGVPLHTVDEYVFEFWWSQVLIDAKTECKGEPSPAHVTRKLWEFLEAPRRLRRRRRRTRG